MLTADCVRLICRAAAVKAARASDRGKGAHLAQAESGENGGRITYPRAKGPLIRKNLMMYEKNWLV